MKKPTVISTFAGCGGSSLGYKLAGFRELLAVEWDQNAVDTFRLNFPGVPVYHGDIAKLTGAECMKLAGGIKPGELDIFDGSPPCQGFSTSGDRKFDDPRNSLFKEFVRLLGELQPKVFVMENVTGLVKGCMKQVYLSIIAELRACGYQCKGEVLNAMYFNVPQSRERVIIIGVRNDLGIAPSHPKPQTQPITVRAAFKGVSREGMPGKLTGISLKLGTRLAAGQGGDELLGVQSWFTHQRLALDNPSPTILKQAVNYYHPTECRHLSVAELKRLFSFPDSFRFQGVWREATSRIGNSVPPNLMKAIAEHVNQAVLIPSRKHKCTAVHS